MRKLIAVMTTLSLSASIAAAQGVDNSLAGGSKEGMPQAQTKGDTANPTAKSEDNSLSTKSKEAMPAAKQSGTTQQNGTSEPGEDGDKSAVVTGPNTGMNKSEPKGVDEN
jgi:hypothetical protein